MNVNDIMSKDTVTVDMDDTLEMVKEIFDHAKFHHLLVTESDILFGVLSDRDLLKSLSPTIGTVAETSRDLDILKKRTHQILTRKPITLSADASIFKAIETFNNNNISCIPIINNTHRPIGIISWRDILRFIENQAAFKP